MLFFIPISVSVFQKKRYIFEYLPTLFSNDRYAKVKVEASLHPVLWGAEFDIFSDGYVIFLLESNIAASTFQSQIYEIPFTYNNGDFLPL